MFETANSTTFLDAIAEADGTIEVSRQVALVVKASRGIEDIYELSYIRKCGSQLPAIVSVTALRDDNGNINGYLLIGTDNSFRKRVELALEDAMDVVKKVNLVKSNFLSSMAMF